MSDPILTFTSQAEWESWLERNGNAVPGAWLRLAKKSAGQPTVSYAQALESALCHGWIDGQKQAESEHYWLQRFTPRATKSIWSKINKAKAEALTSAGRMRPAGLLEIDRAKQDGRWDAAYSSASTSTIPDDLQQALDAHWKAKAFFATLNSQNRYAILFRIQNSECQKGRNSHQKDRSIHRNVKQWRKALSVVLATCLPRRSTRTRS